MLAGNPATQQCFQLSSSYASLLPADVDGTTPPPAGTPNYLVNRLSNALGFWKFHVDWSNAGNSTLTGTTIPVAAYNAACGGGACVPQPNTKQKLDSLADRLMFRLAYRNFGNGDERMVVNHAVMVNNTNKPNTGNAAIRWYEIRNMGSSPVHLPAVLVQSRHQLPLDGQRGDGQDGQHGCGLLEIEQQHQSEPGLCHPRCRRPTGHARRRNPIVNGTGSQLSNLSRWGDYTHMSVDPVDDCTFWYTGQYLKANGTFNWSTRVASFKIATCQ